MLLVCCGVLFLLQGLDEKDEDKKMENLYTGQGVGADEEGDDDEDEADGNVRNFGKFL